MKVYQVTIPIAGSIYVDVEAEDEEEAKEKALNRSWSISLTSDDNSVSLGELEPLEHICQGNVCFAPVWDIEAEEV